MFKITCYDEKRFPITHLTQWDIDITLFIEEGTQLGESPNLPVVHWSNRYTTDALVVETTMDSNGMLAVKVPNILLQKGTPIIGYMYIYGINGAAGYSKSIYSIRLPVRPRQKPMDYMYTETEILTIQRVEKRLNEKIDELDERINAKVDELDERINKKVDELDERINKKVDELDQRLNDKIDEVDQKLSDEIDDLEQRMTDKIDEVDNRLNTKIDTVETTLNTRITTVETTLNTRIDTVEKTLNDRITTVVTELTNKIETVETELTDKINTVETTLNERITTVETELTTKINTVEKTLNDRIDALETDLNDKIDAANTRIDDLSQDFLDHIQDKSNPHEVTKAQVGLGNADNTSDLDKPISTATQAALDKKADLDESGKVPASQLPSYVDDVLEFDSLDLFPVPGENGKIYTDLSTELIYRWSGSTYIEISKSLALGETESTAYRGDRGKIAYDHAMSPHVQTKADIGLGNVDNTSDMDKPVSTATQNAINIAIATLEGSSGSQFTAINDLLNQKVDKVEGKGLSSNDFTDEEKEKLAGLENYTHPTTPGWKHIPEGGSEGQILQWLEDGAAQWAPPPGVSGGGAVSGVKGDAETEYRSGNVNITAENIGLGNVDNTSDMDKPVSTAVQNALTNLQNTLQQNIDNIDVTEQLGNYYTKAEVDEKLGSGGGGIIVSATAPEGNPSMLWIDTGNSGIAKYWNGTAWVTVKAVWG